MAEIYNGKVVEVASGIKSDMSAVQDIVGNIRRNVKADGSKLKVADLEADCATVRAIATKYGYNLTDWLGNDEPVPVADTEV